MTTRRILIADDEVNALRVLAAGLTGPGVRIETALSGEEALERLAASPFDLVISDYRMTGMSGEELLAQVKARWPATPFILLTAYGTIELAVGAMRKGAYTYLTKPVDLALLTSIIDEALTPDAQPAAAGAGRPGFCGRVGHSRAMQEVFSLIRRVAKTDATVLILGESGTGKELVARAIHKTSARAAGPFVAIDCTTIPHELLESELFGHEKGAFTGAGEAKIGLIEMAQAGTAFFDEIGDLDGALQKKLLRFLQEREIRRVGGKERLAADVRILAATNRDLEGAVSRGEFRSDLFYRLNVIPVALPPLRQRREDIPLLARHCLQSLAARSGKAVRELDREVVTILQGYDWPGNVRELENVLERAVILCPDERIHADCLPVRLNQAAATGAPPASDLNLLAMERGIIKKALDETGWNQCRAADLLGISRKQLRTKMRHHGFLAEREPGEQP
ncbi:MAG: sigma-54 dependent transcriptional regulator [Thermodesulfobacteriota bacterium]